MVLALTAITESCPSRKHDHGRRLMKQPVYLWVFEDGHRLIQQNMTPVEMRVNILKHGKCIDKKFVRWDDGKEG